MPAVAYFCLGCSGDIISPANANALQRTQLVIRRRFQFSSSLKRMSTVSMLPGGKTLAAVKGAPETIKTMLSVIPEHYDDTYKWFTRRGSRVLALGMKEMEAITVDKVSMVVQCCVVSWFISDIVDQQTSKGPSRKQADLRRVSRISLSS